MQFRHTNNGRNIYKTYKMKYNKILNIIRFEVTRYLKSNTFLYSTILFPLFVGLLLYVNLDRQKRISLLVQNTTEIPFSLDSCKNIIPIVIDKKMPLDEAFANNQNSHAILKLSFISDSHKLDATIYKKQKFPLEFYSTIRECVLKTYADYLHGDSVSIMMKDAEDNFSLNQVFYAANPSFEKGNKSASNNINLTIAAIMLIYFIVFQFSNNIMKSISVEKQNKISEILLSSVKPKTIIFGKIISGYLLALIQMVVWGIIIYLIVNMFFNMSELNPINLQSLNSGEIPILSTNDMIMFLAVFLLCITGGYFMYASLFAIIGAMANENTDTQKFSFILTMPLIITFIYVMEYIQNCNSTVVFLSYFPITSPIALMARLSSGISFIEILLSLLILLFSMLVCIKLSSSLYRNAIIADTEKITIKTLIKWLRQ